MTTLPFNDPGGDSQVQYGRRFIMPYYCTDYQINSNLCPEDPENVCTQIDENKPLPVPNSDIEKEGCEDIMGQFALDVMGYKPPRNARILADPEGLQFSNLSVLTGHMVKPIEPSSLEMGGFLNIDGVVSYHSTPTLLSINPTMKGEVTKKMCSLKDYSFTIGD